MTTALNPQPSEFKFQDSQNRVWDLKVNLGIARRIDASDFSQVTQLPFTFLNPGREFFGEVFSNMQLAMALIWAIVQDQVELNLKARIGSDAEAYSENPVTKEGLPIVSYDQAEQAFIAGLDGNAIKDGKEALVRALADFFPEQRIVLLGLQNKFKKIQSRLEMELKQFDTELDSLVDDQMTEQVLTFRKSAAALRADPGVNSSSASVK